MRHEENLSTMFSCPDGWNLPIKGSMVIVDVSSVTGFSDTLETAKIPLHYLFQQPSILSSCDVQVCVA